MGSSDKTTRLMKVPDVAKYLDTSEAFVRQLLMRGEIPCLKVNSLVRFKREEIDRWLEKCRRN